MAPYFYRQAADLRHVDFTALQQFACIFQQHLVKLIVVIANVGKSIVKQ